MAINVGTLKTVDCACRACVAMCERRPCFGTPEDLRKLVDAGFGDRLTLYFKVHPSGAAHGYFEHLVPSTVRSSKSPSEGRCTFLNVDGRCDLHDDALKPTEGRVALHDMNNAQELRDSVAFMWNNAPSQELVRRWKALKHGH